MARNATVFEDIKEGLEEAIAFNKGIDTGAVVVIADAADIRE